MYIRMYVNMYMCECVPVFVFINKNIPYTFKK